MAGSFNLRISIPNKICADVNVSQVSFNTVLGQTCILPNHAPIIGTIAPGYVNYKQTDGSHHVGLANYGVFIFKENKLVILSDFFETGSHGVDTSAIESIEKKIAEETAKLKLSQKAITSLNSFMKLVSSKAKTETKRK